MRRRKHKVHNKEVESRGGAVKGRRAEEGDGEQQWR